MIVTALLMRSKMLGFAFFALSSCSSSSGPVTAAQDDATGERSHCAALLCHTNTTCSHYEGKLWRRSDAKKKEKKKRPVLYHEPDELKLWCSPKQYTHHRADIFNFAASFSALWQTDKAKRLFVQCVQSEITNTARLCDSSRQYMVQHVTAVTAVHVSFKNTLPCSLQQWNA